MGRSLCVVPPSMADSPCAVPRARRGRGLLAVRELDVALVWPGTIRGDAPRAQTRGSPGLKATTFCSTYGGVRLGMRGYDRVATARHRGSALAPGTRGTPGHPGVAGARKIGPPRVVKPSGRTGKAPP
ncbi:MAG: hypothetical protein Kow0010_22560 [Dehalococcoidia bacterium]